jgi:hypothetical protein
LFFTLEFSGSQFPIALVRLYIYNKARKSRTGQVEQDRQNRTCRTGLPEWDRQNRTGTTRQGRKRQVDRYNWKAKQDWQNEAARTGLLERQLGQDRMERIATKRQPAARDS